MLNAVGQSTPYIAPAAPAVKVAAPLGEEPGAQPLDPIDLSDFVREDRNTDAGKLDVKDKKGFKDIREYIGYMLLMYNKLRGLEEKPGEINIDMEDRKELAKVRDQIDDAELVA